MTELQNLWELRDRCRVIPRPEGLPPMRVTFREPASRLKPATDRVANGDRAAGYRLGRELVRLPVGREAIVLGAMAFAAEETADAIELLQAALAGPLIRDDETQTKMWFAFSGEGALEFRLESLGALALLTVAYAKADAYSDAIRLAAAAYALVEAAPFLVLHLQLLRDQERWEDLIAAADTYCTDEMARYQVELLRAKALEAVKRSRSAAAIYERIEELRDSPAADRAANWIETAAKRRALIRQRRSRTPADLWTDTPPPAPRKTVPTAPGGADEEHAPSEVAAAERRLWCERGQHVWKRTRSPGRVPANCPEHRQAPGEGGRENGLAREIRDVKNCFLLENGWAVRVPIDESLLDEGAWPVSDAVAGAAGLNETGTLELAPLEGPPWSTLKLVKAGVTCTMRGLVRPILRSEPTEGDFAFVCFREGRYSITLRRKSELEGADALGRLLWSCGLDPSDTGVRQDAWHLISRAVGAANPTRHEIRRRLEVRCDLERAEMLESTSGLVAGEQRWPGGWQYTSAEVESDGPLLLSAADGRHRVAVGVVDVSGQPDAKLVVTEGGLAWLDVPPLSGQPAAEETDARLPGLILASRNPGWNRWVRAEHRLRVAGLRGDAVELAKLDDDWEHGGHRGSLLDLLGRLAPPSDAAPEGPAVTLRQPYPRNALAFGRALADAESRGLRKLAAEQSCGIAALYDDGTRIVGCSLLDVLQPPRRAR